MSVKIINKSTKAKCYKCGGKGWTRDRDVAEECTRCNGEGMWSRDNYYLVVQLENGQKIAFQSECRGK